MAQLNVEFQLEEALMPVSPFDADQTVEALIGFRGGEAKTGK